MKKLIFYINGKFIAEDKAKIPVMDLGILRGYGVFDFLRTYNRQPFFLEEHIKRLFSSAKIIGLDLPWLEKEIKRLVLLALDKNKFLKEANIRILVTGGKTKDSITPFGKPTLLILVTPAIIYPEDFYKKGIKIITVGITRAIPRAKSLTYIPGILALKEAKKKKAVEAIYVNEDNNILEGTTTNIFFFKNNILITPKDAILLGITRQIILNLAKKRFKIEERKVKYQELKQMDECFITASNKEIMPVIKIDNITVGNGEVGKNTKIIIKLFREFIKGGLWKI